MYIHTSISLKGIICLECFSIQTTNTKPRINKLTCMSSITEICTDELLFTKSGRQALKVRSKKFLSKYTK